MYIITIFFDHPELSPSQVGLKAVPLVIEDEVWIGEGAVILKGVSVGKKQSLT